MAKAHPYLHFNGNCEEVFNFYRSVFGGDFESLSRYKDVPLDQPVEASESDRILHIALPLGSDSVLMGSDVPEAFPKAMPGTNYYISLSVETRLIADKIFHSLCSGGRIAMHLGDMFWGAYFGMVIDRYNVQWMISYDKQDIDDTPPNDD